MVDFFKELRRRNMFRLVGAYVVGAWFLVQTAVTLKVAMNLPGWFDTMIVALAIIGFPVALVLGWIFDLTPEGFVKTDSAKSDPEFAEKKGRILDLGILAGLIAVGGVILFSSLRQPTVAPPSVRTISSAGNAVAVLPFTNRSAEAGDAYFADGIHDELLTQLSKISGLEVISRTSVMGYRETTMRIPEIATELGAAAVLEGAVQRAGERVRITVQLIDGAEDIHLWAEDYDRALTTENLFDIQSEITQLIATSLKTVLTSAEKTRLEEDPTESVAAYDAYIKGSLLISGGQRNLGENLLPALAHFEDAIAADAGFGQAWADKAYTEMAIYWFEQREGRMEGDYRERGRASLEQAKSLAPNALETRFADAYFSYWVEQDYKAAEAAFEAALDVAPSHARSVAGKAFLLRRLGKFEDAATLLSKAHRLDPLNYSFKPELALTYAIIGDFESADSLIGRARQQDPDSIYGAIFEAAVEQFKGNPDAAWNAISRTRDIFPRERLHYALATGDPAKIRYALDAWPEEKRSPENGLESFALSEIHALEVLGETEMAKEKTLALKARLGTVPPVTEWDSSLPYRPLAIPALLGDKEAVERYVKLIPAVRPRDKQSEIVFIGDAIDALNRIGEPERALDYMAEFIELTGPHAVLIFEDDPFLKNLHDHPRFKAFQADYAAIKDTL